LTHAATCTSTREMHSQSSPDDNAPLPL